MIEFAIYVGIMLVIALLGMALIVRAADLPQLPPAKPKPRKRNCIVICGWSVER